MKLDVQHERRVSAVLLPSLLIFTPAFRATHPSKKSANETVTESNGACSESVRSL